jgi:outer membrane protein assembly factor BamB
VTLLLTLASGACSGSNPPSGPAPSERTLTATSSTSARPVTGDDWPTYHRDNARTGLAPSVGRVGRLSVGWKATLDGAVYGQPLVVGDIAYAGTENDTVYGLDASTGAVRWTSHLGSPMPRRDLPCGNIDPLGITSTMAYDASSGLVFALAETTGAHHTLFGLDARTGGIVYTRSAEPPHGDLAAHQQRAALTVLNGRVYVAYGGLYGDCGSYIGAVVSLPIVGSGPALTYAVPTTREAGIWAPGGASLANNRLLYSVGNGEAVSGAYDGSDSVLALQPDLQLADRFTPAVWADDNEKDLDLGSMSPAVVGQYVLIVGKRGIGYTARLDRLGGVGGQVAQAQVCYAFGGGAVDGDTVFVPCRDGVRAVRVDAAGQITVKWHGPGSAAGSPVVGGGAVWVVDYDGGTLYVLDEATGAVRQQIAVGTMPHFASPTLAHGHAYLGTVNGVVAVTTTG